MPPIPSSNWPVYQSGQYKGTFFFPITAEQLFYIEKHREADLPASLSITVQSAMQETLPHVSPGGYSPTVIRAIETNTAQQYFFIPQSLWVASVLPKLGYHAGTLVEIPAVPIILPKEYEVAKTELLQAHKYFTAGDFDKTIAHCRSATDSIRPDFPEFKPGRQTQTRFAWLKQQDSDTYDYIKDVVHAVSNIAHKAHHARKTPSTGNFTRIEAITALNITTNIIAYIGTLCPEPLPSATTI